MSRFSGFSPQTLSLFLTTLDSLGVKTFAKQTVFEAHLTGKKHVSAAKLLESKAIDPVTHEKLKQRREDEKDKQVAWLEVKISKLAELLGLERYQFPHLLDVDNEI